MRLLSSKHYGDLNIMESKHLNIMEIMDINWDVKEH